MGFGSNASLVEFEVFTVVVMTVAIFWDTAPHSSYMNQWFVRTYHLHLKVENQVPSHIIAHWFLAWLIFFFTLKILVIWSPKMSVHIWTTWCYIPEDGSLCYLQISKLHILLYLYLYSTQGDYSNIQLHYN
jgi:hypothetical protein